MHPAIEDYVEEPASAPPWIATDTIIISILLIAAAVTRFWHLGHPAEIVFDEVHFVAQGRHYLHGESFLDPHPPLAKLVIAAGHPDFRRPSVWSWRVGNATIGTALVGITYLLGRRMTGLAAGRRARRRDLLCDGMYLVDSRLAVIDIVYLTCAAVAYLLLFKFAETVDAKARRRILPWIGLALGLCLASKLYIPAVTFLLVLGFCLCDRANRPKPAPPPPQVESKPVAEAKSKKVKARAPVAAAIDLFESDLDALHCAHLHCARTVVAPESASHSPRYILLSIVAVPAIRGAEIFWRRPFAVIGAPRLPMPSMAELFDRDEHWRDRAVVGAVASIATWRCSSRTSSSDGGAASPISSSITSDVSGTRGASRRPPIRMRRHGGVGR